MTDVSIDVLLEAVREIAQVVADLEVIQDPEWGKVLRQRDKLDALIAQRRGRPDDQPAK